MGTERTSATVTVDGNPIWYETEGDGEPLVLLHGGMATNATWGAQFAGFSPHRRVVAPERQGHGHTADRDGPISYQSMAAETIGFLETLGLGPVDLVGWSDGGMVGFLIAAQRPELVRNLVLTGCGFASDGYVPGGMEELLSLTETDDDMVMFAALYAQASPDGPEHFAVVWEKVRAMWAEPFDWSADLDRIVAPTLVTLGDDDMITAAHGDELARRVATGQLAVIPGTSHLAPMEKSDLYNQLVLDFTAAPAAETLMPWRRRAAG
ncbi:MAG TPA: alpha/beta hydrolase [Acidimicrobiales bacterium]|jgi:pimeloyl-ACP methyl ester carboxylesterase|nr:alpha/beta hydrolase [Acidimicrobiales bacterium]